MHRVEHRELTEQRTHGTAMSNVFHCNLPPLLIHSLFRLLRQSHYDYPKELFLLGRATSPASRAKSPRPAPRAHGREMSGGDSARRKSRHAQSWLRRKEVGLTAESTWCHFSIAPGRKVIVFQS